MTEPFAKIINGLKPLAIFAFAKSSILSSWVDSKYASTMDPVQWLSHWPGFLIIYPAKIKFSNLLLRFLLS